MKKIIFFDLGNVFLSVNKEIAAAAFAKLCGMSAREFWASIDWNLEERYETGGIGTEQYLDIFREKYKIADNTGIDDYLKIWGDIFTPITPVWELLPVLKKQTRVFLLSNTNALHIQAVNRRWDLLEKFDGLALSYELGCRKPNPEIYQKALALANVSPEMAIFIDDLPENVVAARSLGIQSHQFRAIGGLTQFLVADGFNTSE